MEKHLMSKEKDAVNNTKLMRDALEVAREFIDNFDGPDQCEQIWIFFEGLIELTVEQGEASYFEANRTEELTFTKDELLKKMHAISPEPLPKSLRLDQLFKKLTIRLEEVNSLLLDEAQQLNKTVYCGINVLKTRGGKGRQNQYFIEAIPIDGKPKTDHLQNERESGFIKYQLESEVPSLPYWSRWIYLIINRKWLVLVIGASPFIAIVFVGLILFLTNIGMFSPSPSLVLIPVFYIVFYWLFFRYFTVVIQYNICLFPEVMLPFRLQSAVLEVELNKPKSNLPLK